MLDDAKKSWIADKTAKQLTTALNKAIKDGKLSFFDLKEYYEFWQDCHERT